MVGIRRGEAVDQGALPRACASPENRRNRFNAFKESKEEVANSIKSDASKSKDKLTGGLRVEDHSWEKLGLSSAAKGKS
jgi:hypothetical protein